jgi:hypothetical protein
MVVDLVAADSAGLPPTNTPSPVDAYTYRDPQITSTSAQQNVISIKGEECTFIKYFPNRRTRLSFEVFVAILI